MKITLNISSEDVKEALVVARLSFPAEDVEWLESQENLDTELSEDELGVPPHEAHRCSVGFAILAMVKHLKNKYNEHQPEQNEQ